MHTYLYLLLSILLFTPSCSSTKAAEDCPCSATDYRQFDFWIGEWEVRDSSNTLLGHNSITPIQDSCALLENWTGASGYTGTSISFFDSNTQCWHQSWIDYKGGAIIMDGQFADGKMVMWSDTKDAQGNRIQNRTSWSPTAAGGVLHLWEQRADSGQPWKVVFEGWYRKKE